MTRTNRHTRTDRAVSGSGTQYLELAVPYYFSSLAREREQDIEIGDYVRVRSLDKRYELMGVFPKRSSVRVREGGSTEELVLPWHLVTPWSDKVIRSNAIFQGVGDWLFKGSWVYLLTEPETPLRVKRIHWDRQTSDLQDKQGRFYRGVSWDELEFWNPVDYHFPDDPN